MRELLEYERTEVILETCGRERGGFVISAKEISCLARTSITLCPREEVYIAWDPDSSGCC